MLHQGKGPRLDVDGSTSDQRVLHSAECLRIAIASSEGVFRHSSLHATVGIGKIEFFSYVFTFYFFLFCMVSVWGRGFWGRTEIVRFHGKSLPGVFQ